MKRIDALDTFRGLMLISMTVNHLIFISGGSSFLQLFTLQPLGFTGDAEGFVFVSGMLAGLVYSSERLNNKALLQKAFTRAFSIYLFHIIGIFIAYVWFQALITNNPENLGYFQNHMPNISKDAGRGFLLSLLLINYPSFFNILPLYIFMMLLLPFIVIGLRRGLWWLILVISVGTWMISGTINREFLGGFYQWVSPGFGPNLGFFNVFAWQILFISGICIGYLNRHKKINWYPSNVLIFSLIIVAIILFLAHREVFPGIKSFPYAAFKPSLRWLRLLNFTILAYLIGYLVKKSPRLFKFPVVGFIGKHGLQVYAWHSVLIFLVFLSLSQVKDASLYNVLIVVCVATLLIPASLHYLWQLKGKAKNESHSNIIKELLIKFNSENIFNVLSRISAIAAVLALATLFVRGLVRFSPVADSLLYHLPFAILRTGLEIRYELNEYFTSFYQGFPFFAEFIQGLLWRMSGSIHATVLVNLLGFFLFLSFCHFKLKVKFWLITLVALTTPMVVIHLTTGYIDLFVGSLVAIPISSLIYAHFQNKEHDKSLFIWAMFGLIGSAWSKMLILPVFIFLILIFIIRTLRVLKKEKGSVEYGKNKKQAITFLGIIIVTCFIAAIPYFKNIAFYNNPVWPFRIPLETNLSIPYKIDDRPTKAKQRPAHLKDYGQSKLFFSSLFEIGHPTEYTNRPRFTLDSGWPGSTFRMGGYWYFSVIIFLLSLFIIPFVINRNKAISFVIVCALFFIFVSILPQSHELRYMLFIPLSWSAAIAIFFSEIKKKHTIITSSLLLIYMGLFVYMTKINWEYYQIKPRSFYDNVANQHGIIPDMWKEMKPDRDYCAVNLSRISLLLTGPTMKEFKIINRDKRELCPKNSFIIRGEYEGFLPFLEGSSDYLRNKTYLILGNIYYNASNYVKSIEAYKNAVAIIPNDKTALNNICSAYNYLKNWNDAIIHCNLALNFDPNFALAKNNLDYSVYQKKVELSEEVTRLLPMLKSGSDFLINQTYLKIGYAYFNGSEFQKSIEAYQNALLINPNNTLALNNICASYNFLKNWDSAIVHCNLALKLDPNFDLAKNNLAYSLHQKKVAKDFQ